MKKKRIIIVLIALIIIGVSVRLGLPAAMKVMGLHPEYVGQRYLLPEGKALIISTSHDRLGDDGDETGVFGSELTAPYYEFQDGRMSVDVASIKGGQIPIDPMSFKWFIKSEYDERFLSDPAFQGKVKNSLLIDDIDFTKYDIIYLAGGWGAAYDLGYSKVLGRKISEAYAADKVVYVMVCSVCCGPAMRMASHWSGGAASRQSQISRLKNSVFPLRPSTRNAN